MKPKKPITNKMAEKANTLFEIMKDNKWHTKEELGLLLGIKNERSVRDVISTLSKRKPIIATSDGKGYKMAMRVCDKDEVRHAWMEIDSRIEELEARRETLKAFYDKAQAKGENPHGLVSGRKLLDKMSRLSMMYGIRFMFCKKEDTAKTLIKILKGEI